MTPAAGADTSSAAAAATTSTQRVGRPGLALALALLAVIVIFEIVAGAALRPARQDHNEADVLALGGVRAMIHDVPVDPTELAHVADEQHQLSPLALPAEALIDGLLLVTVTSLALPRLLPQGARARSARARDAAGGEDSRAQVTNGDVTRGARLGSFFLSLAILLVSIAVAVAAIARLRYLVALYLSPPWGTLSELLLYGSFRRSAALVALTVLMALKVGACALVLRAFPRAAAKRGLGGLALTSVAATVVATLCYALAPASRGAIADALAAAVIALAALLWAGVIVSGSVRRLV